MKHILFLFLITIYAGSIFTDSVVRIREGDIDGVEKTSRNGKKFLAFSGIPYAEPPIGPLRFRNPVPKKPWTGTLYAHQDGNECTQIDQSIIGSEDCLYLNVYTPQLNPKSLLPVMAYIPGGAFIKENASEVSTGPGFLLDKNVVLVTFNYRLGIFGFISTGDKAAPGNFGLKDQRLALRWIRRNIRNFGGDPDNVTLFGQSAGGESVHLHVLSEKSKKLFKRYITESGMAIYPRAFATDLSYYKYAKKIGNMFNCTTTDNHLMIECLRGISAEELVNTTSIFDEIAIATSTKWRPTTEPEGPDAFLADTPANLIRNNMMKDCPLITGNVKNEAKVFASAMETNEKLYQQAVKQPLDVIKGLLRYYEPVRGMNLTDLAIKIKNYYFGSKIPDDKTTVIYKYLLIATDCLFLYPQVQLVNHLQNSNKGPVYFYLFNYRGALSNGISLNLGDDIIAHADELFYIFPRSSEIIDPQYKIKRTPRDYKIVNLMVDLWTSFANNSIPASNQLHPPDLWQPYSSGEYLKIGNISKPVTTLARDFFKERMNFWYTNVPQYSL